MLTVLRVDGYRFFFYSNEGNEPPYIHVEAGEKDAKFWLNPVRLVKSMGFRSSDLKRLRELIEQDHSLMEEKWHDDFGD